MIDIVLWLFGPPQAGILLAFQLMLGACVLVSAGVATSVLTREIQSHRENEAEIRKALEPVISAGEELLKRVLEVLVDQRQAVLADIAGFDPRQPIGRPWNRHVTLAYRIGAFLGAVRFFDIRLRRLRRSKTVEFAEFFLSHKIRVALRGNVYRAPILSTEEQEELADRFLAVYRWELEKPDLHPPDDLGSIASFGQLLRTTRIDTALLSDETTELNRQNPGHALLFAWHHLAVYLIDFLQTIDTTARWDDQRILLVRRLQTWISPQRRPNYLYYPGDLTSGNYLDTYPERVSSRVPLLPFGVSFMRRLNDDIEDLWGRFCKWWYLNARGRRFSRRHERRRIMSKGVWIHEKGQPMLLAYASAPNQLITLYRGAVGHRRHF